MIYRSGLLAAALCVQLLVVAGVVYFDAMESTGDQGEAFLAFSPDSVDEIVISSAEEQVKLSKSGSSWVVADRVPADNEKIGEVLEKLAELRLGWPVATSADTQERFEVAADNYQRHVELYDSKAKLAAMYLGSSPGYRRVHARNGESDDIYSLDFSTFEVPTAADDWLDKALLGADGAIKEISRAGLWTLAKTDEGWTLADLGVGTTGAADQDSADQLAERLNNLRVTALAESGAELGEPVTITVTDSAGAHELRMWHDKEADEYVFASDRVASRVTVASYLAEQIALTADDLAVSAVDEAQE